MVFAEALKLKLALLQAEKVSEVLPKVELANEEFVLENEA